MKKISENTKEFSSKGYKNITTFVVDVAIGRYRKRAATEVLLEIGEY